MKHLISMLLIGTALAGCATLPPISSDPGTDVARAIAPPDSTIATGLQNAAYNLDSAIAIGVLPKDDPASACVHGFLQQAGLERAPGQAVEAKSFTPKVTDLISAGSVLYIKAQQAKQAGAGALVLPASCNAIIGMFVVDSVKAGFAAATTVLPGAGPLLSIIKAH